MEKLPSGFWVPDGCYGKPYFRDTTPEGLSKHCEEHIAAVLKHLPQRSRGLAIDGGAYVGIWTQHLARHFSKVVAFEPITDNFVCLVKNVDKLENVVLVGGGLSDKDGEVQMTDLGKAYGYRIPLVDDPKTPSVTAHMHSLDSFDWSVDFLKLDVEGNELPALQGAQKTIVKNKSVVLIEEKLNSRKEATRFLRKLGMRCIWRQKNDYLFVW